jgi:hypothetical protein
MVDLIAKTGHVWVKCKKCDCDFQARIADRNRGWGKFCSKSCKAKEQENRTGQYRAYASRQVQKINGSTISRELAKKSKDLVEVYDDGSFTYINHFGGWDDHKFD